jgi:hypothetical protein
MPVFAVYKEFKNDREGADTYNTRSDAVLFMETCEVNFFRNAFPLFVLAKSSVAI